jgi:hypothetical protein
VSDYRAVPALLDMPVTKPKALLADKVTGPDCCSTDLAVHERLHKQLSYI